MGSVLTPEEQDDDDSHPVFETVGSVHHHQRYGSCADRENSFDETSASAVPVEINTQPPSYEFFVTRPSFGSPEELNEERTDTRDRQTLAALARNEKPGSFETQDSLDINYGSFDQYDPVLHISEDNVARNGCGNSDDVTSGVFTKSEGYQTPTNPHSGRSENVDALQRQDSSSPYSSTTESADSTDSSSFGSVPPPPPAPSRPPPYPLTQTNSQWDDITYFGPSSDFQDTVFNPHAVLDDSMINNKCARTGKGFSLRSGNIRSSMQSLDGDEVDAVHV